MSGVRDFFGSYAGSVLSSFRRSWNLQTALRKEDVRASGEYDYNGEREHELNGRFILKMEDGTHSVRDSKSENKNDKIGENNIYSFLYNTSNDQNLNAKDDSEINLDVRKDGKTHYVKRTGSLDTSTSMVSKKSKQKRKQALKHIEFFETHVLDKVHVSPEVESNKYRQFLATENIEEVREAAFALSEKYENEIYEDNASPESTDRDTFNESFLYYLKTRESDNNSLVTNTNNQDTKQYIEPRDVPTNQSFRRLTRQNAIYLRNRSFEDSSQTQVNELENIDECKVYDVRSSFSDRSTIVSVMKRKSKPFVNKQDYIIDELIATEEEFIKSLRISVYEYRPFIEACEGELGENTGIIFGNLEEILELTQRFCNDLCRNNHSHECVANLFLYYENLFESYSYYMSTREKAAKVLRMEGNKDIVRRKEDELNDKLGLKSHLMQPVQRLPKYKLLLTDLKTIVDKAGESSVILVEALNMIEKYLNKMNDIVLLQSFSKKLGYDFTGSCLIRERCRLLSPTKEDIILFVFENSIILSTVNVDDPSKFLIKDHMRMTSVQLRADEGDKLYLKHYHKEVEFCVKFKTMEIKQEYFAKIEKLLWKQAEQEKKTAKTKIQEMSFEKTENKKKKKKVPSCCSPYAHMILR